MNDLLRSLSEASHPVEAAVRPEKTLEGFKAAMKTGYVHIRFTNTLGGTELGFKLDPKLTDLSDADLNSGRGQIRIGGMLTLDYERVRCIAELDLSSLNGSGQLEIISAEK
jgi:hypothetical protein